MPYLVDGHNLIPQLGLRLDSFDDEMALVARLQEFCRLRRTRVEVYFDGAPAGQTGPRKFGAVTAHFVRQGATADAAIEARLARLGREARNWSVVSSDGRVQQAARAVHAEAVPGGEFAARMRAAAVERSKTGEAGGGLNPEEIEEWLTMFRNRPKS
jgi:hypothetical protein